MVEVPLVALRRAASRRPVVVALVKRREEAKRLVVVAEVPWKVVAKNVVVVPFVPEKFCKVVEERARRFCTVVKPVFEMEKSVVVEVSLVEEEILKTSGLIGDDDARKMERLAMGEVVPRPTFPSGSMRKSVAEDDPMANGIVVPDAFTLSVANCEVVPMPTLLANVLFPVVEVATT